MSERSWTVAEPRRIDFDESVGELHVRLVSGTVNVVGVDEGPARLEISEVEGPPLIITRRDDSVTVAYEDLHWKGLLGWLDGKGWKRHAVVSVAVPATATVEVGVVGASAVVSGIDGRTAVRGVSGDTALVGLSGPVEAHTVSGRVDVQALSGDLRVSTVSGDLTVVEGTSSRIKADSVSGNMVLDLAPRTGADIRLSTVSGEIAIRVPERADTSVNANSASGPISCDFEELRVSGPCGARRISGHIGGDGGTLRASTVSGAIALLRRPPGEPVEVGALRKDH